MTSKDKPDAAQQATDANRTQREQQKHQDNKNTEQQGDRANIRQNTTAQQDKR